MNYQHLFAWGLTEEVIEQANNDDHLFLARVVLQQREQFTIVTEEEEITAQVSGKFLYEAEEETDFPVTGDWVLFRYTDDLHQQGVIHQVLYRKSCLKRKAAGTKEMMQVIASNIDLVMICMAMNEDFNLRRLERYLSIVWNSGATPLVVLTKEDLATDYDQQLRETQTISIGAEVVSCSNQSDIGYQEILPYVNQNKTIALIGSSGVGKSSMINYLLGEEKFEVKELRRDSQGRHTTTFRQMVQSPHGAVIIDTPGMREIQIESIELDVAFSDIENLSEECKFRDCTHTVEPGCAVLDAIEQNILEARRLKNYQKMQKELLRISQKGRKNMFHSKRKN